MKRFLGMLFILILVPLFAACGSINEEPKAPASLTGEWHQTDSGIPGAVMTAGISEGQISINLKLDKTSGVYWVGSFDSNMSTSKPFTTVSVRDRAETDFEILASTDPAKKFSYKDGEISFKFSIMGESTTVHLSK